eukprot:366230-Chlamydomonas_euryale.AAC.22
MAIPALRAGTPLITTSDLRAYATANVVGPACYRCRPDCYCQQASPASKTEQDSAVRGLPVSLPSIGQSS